MPYNILYSGLFFTAYFINIRNQYLLIMKTTVKTLHHLQGEQAYQIYWAQYYQSQPRLSSIKAIDLNLEIIIDNNLTMLAFRHDYPDDLMPMVINAGFWQIFEEEEIGSEVLVEVKNLIVRVRYEMCIN